MVPLSGAGVGAVYSRRFVEDVNQKAQDVFSNARQYLLQHRDSSVSVLEAYEKSKALLQQAAPKLLENIKKNGHTGDELILDKEIPIEGNDHITQVKVLKKTDSQVTDEAKDEEVSEGLDSLADKLVEPVADKHVQQPALSEPAPEDIEDTLAQAEAEGDVTEEAEVAAADTKNDQSEADTEAAQQKPKKATKSSAKKSTEDVTKDAD